MKITCVVVGKVKETFYRQAIDEFCKRLANYCKLQIIEVNDEKIPDKAGVALEGKIKGIEGDRIEKHIREQDYVIALAIEGTMLDSLELSHKIHELGVGGTSHIVFVIGGSLGLSDSVIKRSNAQLSFSRMTFPHQLMRVILLEQIYRSFRIISGAPYHK